MHKETLQRVRRNRENFPYFFGVWRRWRLTSAEQSRKKKMKSCTRFEREHYSNYFKLITRYYIYLLYFLLKSCYLKRTQVYKKSLSRKMCIIKVCNNNVTNSRRFHQCLLNLKQWNPQHLKLLTKNIIPPSIVSGSKCPLYLY